MSDTHEFILEAKEYTDGCKINGSWEIAAIVLDNIDDSSFSGGGFKGAIITYWERSETLGGDGEYSDYVYVSESELIKLYNESSYGKRFIYYSDSKGLIFPYKLGSYTEVATDGWTALWYDIMSYPAYISCSDGKYSLVSEGHIRVLYDGLYCCLAYSTAEFEYFDSKGVLQKKVWSDKALNWVKRKLFIENDLFLSLESIYSAFVKYYLRKTAELSVNKEYQLAVARNRLTHTDCSEEPQASIDEIRGKCLQNFNPCASGVCRLVGDIDTARLFLPLPNDIRVLDFSECKYLSKIEFEMCGVDTGLPKTSIVLPKGGRSVLSVVVDCDVAITEVGFPRYGGNTLVFIGDGWIRAESLFFNEAIIEGISKIQIIGCEENSANIQFYNVNGVHNLDIWCDYTQILCGREIEEASDLTCKIDLYKTDTEVLRVTGNAPNLNIDISSCEKLREVDIETEGTVLFNDIIALVNRNPSLERVTVKAGRIVGKALSFEKEALNRGVAVSIEAESIQINSKVSLSFNTGKIDACTLSWDGEE